MSNSSSPVMLGVILCERCDKVLEEVDTEKVIVYYHRCDACAADSEIDGIGGDAQ
ncbi:GapA-binding peptide SR1P [Paenibacillus profundus]|uniref:GapA-binding peptide SR1P n=1 Tax=Paenibacillus profundus TaxID=1173085 RepID=A0ABS8YJB3_9BACL|nr:MULTISPECIES: GapA-binding peptide SR1P [Paenibacillus]MCE5171993.1 GapA-binding peptide SR1P [Paenibacillus profundus]MCM3338101.1 GapA-binding peptide SR1P [Paenibacillus sp. MER TA 81-3]